MRDDLRAAGVCVFLPTYRVVTRWSDRNVTTERPLFPGYLFARVGDDGAAILRTRDVFAILRSDGKPAAIPDAQIEALKVFALAGTASPCAYVAGRAVRIVRGPFAGVSGVVSKTEGATTLTIPIAIFGRAVHVRIDAADVERDENTQTRGGVLHDRGGAGRARGLPPVGIAP